MKLSNPHWPNCVNLHTFVVDKVLIDKDYLLDWFKKNKKRSVNGVKRKGGKFDKVNVVKWLNNTTPTLEQAKPSQANPEGRGWCRDTSSFVPYFFPATV